MLDKHPTNDLYARAFTRGSLLIQGASSLHRLFPKPLQQIDRITEIFSHPQLTALAPPVNFFSFIKGMILCCPGWP